MCCSYSRILLLFFSAITQNKFVHEISEVPERRTYAFQVRDTKTHEEIILACDNVTEFASWLSFLSGDKLMPLVLIPWKMPVTHKHWGTFNTYTSVWITLLIYSNNDSIDLYHLSMFHSFHILFNHNISSRLNIAFKYKLLFIYCACKYN